MKDEKINVVMVNSFENGYKNFVRLNGVIIDWERDRLPVRKDLSG
jgi:hypothetical protein